MISLFMRVAQLEKKSSIVFGKISGLFCDVFISISPFRKYVYQLMALSIAETIKKINSGNNA